MSRTAWPVAGAIMLLAGVALWTVIASATSLAVLGQLAYFRAPWWQWWLIRPYWALNWREVLAIFGGALVATLPFVLLPALLLVAWRNNWNTRLQPSLWWAWQSGRIRRGVSDNHGHADWMPLAHARKLFPGPDPRHGGVVVGECYRVDHDQVAGLRFDPRDRGTWGRGGTAPLLIDPGCDGSTHSLLFAGPGGYKTMSLVSTLLHWHGAAVVMDPSAELGPMLTDARKAMGHKVVTLSPDAPAPDTPAIGMNVLDWIDITSPLAESHVQSVVSWVCEDRTAEQGVEDPFFGPSGRNLVTCLLANILWGEELPAERKTLALLRDEIVQPEQQLQKHLTKIHADSKSRLAQHLAGSFMEMKAEETWSGIYANAVKQTSWLSKPAYARMVSGNAFRTADLAGGALTVFIQVPLETLITEPGPARVLVGSLLNAVYRADGGTAGRVLFALDEAARLGRMPVLELARDTGRKYGVTLALLFQSVGQLEETWGKNGKRAWYDAASWRAYAAIRDEETAKELSEAFGEHGVMAYSESDNSGRQGGQRNGRSTGQNINRHEIKRRLITPDELTHDTRDDELFVIVRGRPLRCGRAIWFRRPEFRDRVKQSRFMPQRQTTRKEMHDA